MNMAYHYPGIYWNCACLTVNASATTSDDDDSSAGEAEPTSVKNKSTNYGKIAKAIGDMQHRGVKITLPDINSADFGFRPDAANDSIIFGLKGINAVGDDIATAIIKNRPYSSVEDFMAKVPASTAIMTNLVKAGCFDSLVPDRRACMMQYVAALTKSKVAAKEKLNGQNFPKALALGIIPEEFRQEAQLADFRRYIFQKQFLYAKNQYILDQTAQLYFDSAVAPYLQEGDAYIVTPDGTAVVKTRFEKWFKQIYAPLEKWLTTPYAAKQYTKAERTQYANDFWEKNCKGPIPDWEMESLSFYYSGHALANVSEGTYGLTPYADIPETPVVTEMMQRKNRATGEIIESPKFQLYKIVGTVLDKNSTKNYITLLTLDGVTTVKFYAGSFSHYDRQISVVGADGKKTVIEKSWFTRGNKLLITGFRRGDTFFPKRYYDSVYQHTVCLIQSVSPTGELTLSFDRKEA